MPDAARIMARIILKLNKGGDYEKGYYTDKLFRQFKDLMTRKDLDIDKSHLNSNIFFCLDYNELKSNTKRLEHVETLTEVLRQLLGNPVLPTDTEILQIYGRVR